MLEPGEVRAALPGAGPRPVVAEQLTASRGRLEHQRSGFPK